MMRKGRILQLALIVAGALAVPATATAADAPLVPGVWSLGETKNCEAPAASAFLAGGCYAEVMLPYRGPFVTGLSKKGGTALGYTQSHMPFSDMMQANEIKQIKVGSRIPDKLICQKLPGCSACFSSMPRRRARACHRTSQKLK